MQQEIVRMESITKDFPGTRALDDVSITLHKGDAVGLIGENGAGKSTLMKILGGVHLDYQGEIKIDGSIVKFTSPKDAEKHGIAFIHQELSLIPHLSVADNIFLGKEPINKFGIIDKKKIRKDSREVTNSLGIDIDTNVMVSELSIGMQQMVEIAKAMLLNAKTVVMDEPTSALTPKEITKLFKVIEILKKKKTTFIYISHKLDEVITVCTKIIAMRNGKIIENFSTEHADTDKLVEAMLGRNIKEYYPKIQKEIGNTVLSVKDFCVNNPLRKGKQIVRNVNFDLSQGEVLGIFGLMGAGRTELIEGIFGAFPKNISGTIYIDGQIVYHSSPADAIANGIALVTEDRKSLGLVLDMSTGENITLSTIKEHSRHLIMNRRLEDKSVNFYINKLNIATSSLRTRVEELSGGNQQKVVIGKCLLTKPKILLLDEPTRGVDVGAKAEIYRFINKLTAKGMGVILVSSDPEEVIGMSDRIMVMRNGKLSKSYSKNDREKILSLAAIGE